MTDSTIVVLVGIVALILLATALLALRSRLTFRIAMRNIRRSRSRTILVILGLLVGTTIISGSFVVGDTLQELELHYTYLGGGLTDEAIYAVGPSGGYTYFPYSTYTQIASSALPNPSIAGMTPMIIDVTQALDKSTGIPQTNLNLIGVNGNQSQVLGSFVADNGTSIAGPAPGEALLDDQAAQQMDAVAGNTLVLFGRSSLVVTVQAVVQDNLRGAYLTGGIEGGNVFVSLPTAQTLQNSSGLINGISITNVGSQQDGVGLSSSVSASLNATLAGIPAAVGLTVHEPLQDAVNAASSAATSITSIFLVLGLFSIVAGAMLIVGIFIMLSEERKGEMGMLRAIGLQRGDLIRIYYFEGLFYSVGSAFAGALLGVAVGYVLVYAFSLLFAGGGLTATAIFQSFTVTPDSLVESYVIGFLLTLITVVVASHRASRLNIVRAIRDVPEPPPPRRLYAYLAYIGVVVAALGALLLATTLHGSSDISDPILGGAMLILGGGLIASHFAPNRPVFTAVGLGLLLWAGLEPLHRAVLGTTHSGGIFVLFVEGILMIGGALLLYIFNSSVLVDGLIRLVGNRPDRTAIVRIGLAHPSRQPGRTVITLCIFALVVFTMVAVATFGATVGSNLQDSIVTESGGYSFVGVSPEPIPNLPGQIANNSTLNADFANVVPVVNGQVNVNVTGYSFNPFADSLYAAPTGVPAASNFYDTNQFTFYATWNGMTPAEVFSALETNTSVAVVDQTYDQPGGAVAGAPSGPHPTTAPGSLIVLGRPGSDATTQVRVIGVLTEELITGIWVNPTAAAHLGYVNQTLYFLTVRAGVSTTTAANQAKAAFYRSGLVLYDIEADLASSIASTQGFIGLLEIFVGLGLAVGISAMGIVALRAVVERRREIGMIRAQGFTQGMVLKSFVLEYSFVTLLGLAIGASLGVLIVYNLSISATAAASGVTSLDIPWLNIVLIVVVAYALAMAAIAVPSIRASRVPPAEAVRATD
ncbi:MAG: FtsX-like permease family protein [Thermoplasmata archaeon]|nr:FtsX-like permease family protein [Thermoplasmata archaeon]